MNTPFDLLIRAGRVVCPATGFDAAGAVAIQGDRIAAIGTDLSGPAHKLLDEPHAILLPGLIDLHAHPAKSGSQFGVDPDPCLLARGTTTVLSQGDAGADNVAEYVRDTVATSQTRIKLAINLSRRGEAEPGGCFAQLDWIDVPACVAAIERNRDLICAISVNVSHHCCGPTDPKEVLRRGLLAAEQTGLPLLYGLRRPEDWPLAEQLAQLRPGDIVTYCFRREPHCIVERGLVIAAVREAQTRGVVFDVGHGLGSFDFVTAETAIRDGFLPDTISTDLQRGHIGLEPTHDLPRVMSKLRAAGMPEAAIFRATTIRPAAALGLSRELGSLQPGFPADLTLLHWNAEPTPLADVRGNLRPAGRWETLATLRAGRLVR